MPTAEEEDNTTETPKFVERRAKKQKIILDDETWKPFLAFTFMIIVLFDFVVAPAFMGMSRMSMETLLPLISSMDKDVQKQIIDANFLIWKPLTLGDGVGMFYLSVGAILTGVAIFGPGGRNASK